MATMPEVKNVERLLLVDDDTALCALLVEYLAANNFHVRTAHNGHVALQYAASEVFDLILLDVMLPGIDGFEVLRRLRTRISTPVLMLTARGDEVDRIVGLEIGADDYLPKPFNTRELIARIRAILRRTANSDSSGAPLRDITPIHVGDVRMNISTRRVWLGENVVNLTSLEFEVLRMLLQSAGLVVTREALSQEILGRRLRPFDRGIDMHVSNLRKKLGHMVNDCERIRTVRGIGYVYSKPAQTTP